MYDSIINVAGLTVELGGNPVLRDMDLTVSTGEIVAVVGPNGSGKSTLLRCLAGLQPATSGEVRVFGEPPADDAAFWSRVALLTDEPAWYPGLTAREHLELMGAVHARARMTVDAAMEMFALVERGDSVPLNLSTGQRQRLSLAATLLRPSALLLLDEPERGLDADFRVRLGDLLADYAAEGGTVVMATHDPGLAARSRQVSPSGVAA
ncbi:heme ABC exporter ATP-binding protein CcmA [Nonomuraea phyllanthi]|uniref:Heme ABC exporter ATP-binding protein CcmA n=1 Tax=Nonomuraea phyllanthi TaxID=2219224 RepID=A0A5C4WSQ3_9ACTN|nr:heme ABC exporter ATP-binding protein CcmA [Nonomuraea phyllanthi]KAB8195754.1 heme ABC exporter ATP-binding protein CcmA [Nonomuraea phyllanthi]QFY07209.1 heme ABC exporter ATP-binding protein CcmA [Nonomuraea phyllanthi]